MGVSSRDSYSRMVSQDQGAAKMSATPLGRCECEAAKSIHLPSDRPSGDGCGLGKPPKASNNRSSLTGLGVEGRQIQELLRSSGGLAHGPRLS